VREFVSVLCLACVSVLSGCAWLGQTKAIAPKPEVIVNAAPAPLALPSKPSAITSDAEAVLKAAEQSVVEARVRRTLWTAASEHLEKAKAAAKKFDSEATIKHAREVIALCELSNQQPSDVPVSWQ
jgi:hypothetical protein